MMRSLGGRLTMTTARDVVGGNSRVGLRVEESVRASHTPVMNGPASVLMVERKTLYRDLDLFGVAKGTPWIIVGDFNAMLSPDDKSGGARGVTWGTLERLDRMVANEEWYAVARLGCKTSHPGQVRPSANSHPNAWGSLASQRPFHFIRDKWQSQGKRKLKKQLASIQALMERNGSAQLVENELEVRTRFEEALDHESDWLMEGDRNTKYFHSRALTTTFFSKLYHDDGNPTSSFPMRGMFPKLSDADRNYLNAMVTDKEIKSALFEMNPLEPPGKTGYMHFLPKLVGHSRCLGYLLGQRYF
ncbi:hypothetical protein F3Y22_tig00110383pilonHSYRG00011 [Hibiscus syriacus]|uniref:Endonuclease/exonuclease/phosphatase domain-containing protein n=1 Tax=Hibiscus syriacus TaxID=106335 RepID=A0A6A3AUB1_HIBSY|nr:hypothetical protein F3Y22_tig00110383pilonHSYRG00011 [Hibiscus syriacus]